MAPEDHVSFILLSRVSFDTGAAGEPPPDDPTQAPSQKTRAMPAKTPLAAAKNAPKSSQVPAERAETAATSTEEPPTKKARVEERKTEEPPTKTEH